MKVVLKLPRLQPKPLGEQIYIEEVVKALLNSDAANLEFVIQSAGIKGAEHHIQKLNSLLTRNAKIQHLPIPETWLEKSIRNSNFPGAKLLFADADIVHNFRCQWVPQGTKGLVLTIQDVIPFRFNEGINKSVLDGVSELVKKINRDIKAIITISEFSKNELIQVLDLDPAKIKVIPDGVDHARFQPILESTKEQAQKKLEAYGIKSPYVLFIGGHVERKNLVSLIKAFDALVNEQGKNTQLVIAGGSKLFPAAEQALQESPNKEKIVRTGYLPDEDLLTLLQLSSLLVFPSLYEGFGLPPLEAMACGVPVCCSNAASLPEVCGNAALYFDPLNISEMKSSMAQLLTDGDLRERLRAMGIKQAQKFSWSKNAEDTISVYRSVCS